MAVKIIVAVAQNGVIGADGTIPWHLPEDLKRFSKLTKGSGNNAVIMGRKTWESIPEKYRPLPGRRNIVVSSKGQANFKTHGMAIARSLLEALEIFSFDCEDIWLIGGQGIYQEALSSYVNRDDGFRIEQLQLTLVHRVVSGDTFFPYFDHTAESSPFRLSGVQYHDGDLPHTLSTFDRSR